MDFVKRFWERVDTSGDCWMWTGKPMNKGYGLASIGGGKATLAHRFSWELHFGPIPSGMVVDHECHNDTDCPGGDACPHRLCVNPEHLKLETIAENVRKSHLAGAKKTHCKNGHEYTPENTFWRKGKYRNCFICKRESAAKNRQKKKTTTPTEESK